MSRRYLPLAALAALLVATPADIAAQTPAPSAPAARPLTADEARRALDVLQDDSRRAQVIDALRAIADDRVAQASPSGQRAAPPTSEGLGAQLLLQVSEQLGDMSHALLVASALLVLSAGALYIRRSRWSIACRP